MLMSILNIISKDVRVSYGRLEGLRAYLGLQTRAEDSPKCPPSLLQGRMRDRFLFCRWSTPYTIWHAEYQFTKTLWFAWVGFYTLRDYFNSFLVSNMFVVLLMAALFCRLSPSSLTFWSDTIQRSRTHGNVSSNPCSHHRIWTAVSYPCQQEYAQLGWYIVSPRRPVPELEIMCAHNISRSSTILGTCIWEILRWAWFSR